MMPRGMIFWNRFIQNLTAIFKKRSFYVHRKGMVYLFDV